ncbi:MAG: hypothetical protein AAGC64_13790 [Bacteroidota bacterium]
MQQLNTSSFVIDLDNSTFKKLKDSCSIIQYSLPAHLAFKKHYFGILHNWAKTNISQPYFLHFPTKKVYVLINRDHNPEILTYDENELAYESFEKFEDERLTHIWLKVLMAQFIELNSNFISNDSFFIYSELNRSKTWATVLKVALNHDYKDKDKITFNIKDSATRIKKISLDEYQKFHKRDVPYGLSFKNGLAVFKQLKQTELKEYSKSIFVKPKPIPGNTFRAKIDYHSIMDENHHEKSRSYIIQNFLSQFIDFLIRHDVSVSTKKLDMIRVDRNSQREKLSLNGLNICLIDARIRKEKPLRQLFISSSFGEEINLFEKKVSEIKVNDLALLVMDYSGVDFEKYFPNQKDPYKEFKSNLNLVNTPKQGICINEQSFLEEESSLSENEYFDYSGLNDQDFQRNLSICISQLYLKSILLSGLYNGLPHQDLLEDKVFVYRNKFLFTKNDKLQIVDINSFDDLDHTVVESTGKDDLIDVLQKMFTYHYPFSKSDFEFDMSRFRLIISRDSIIELTDYPERGFYDDDEIKERIKNRNQRHAIAHFTANESSELAIKYNEYIQDNVEELSISYEELKTKYGKGEDGFLKRIFYNNEIRKTYTDTPFREFLEQNKGLKIKGLKEGGIFSTHTGIWFDKGSLQYFVGRTLGYGQHKQDKGFQMKKILVHSGQFDPETFFPLLNIDFIRFKELTVNPYPFKLIDMMIELEEDRGTLTANQDGKSTKT